MINKNEELVSSFDKLMANPKTKEMFDKAYNDLVLSELVTSMMEDDELSVRQLAKLAGLSPTIIQELKSGKKDNVTLKSFDKIVSSMGYKIILKKGRKQIPVKI